MQETGGVNGLDITPVRSPRWTPARIDRARERGRELQAGLQYWEVLGAPSPSEYLPLHREASRGSQWAAGRTGSSALTTFELRANIAQWSCRDLLVAIRDRLGYGSLSSGKLYFNCANAVRFWEEVVLTYGVSHVHRYGTYHHLACRGRHYIPYGEDNSPCVDAVLEELHVVYTRNNTPATTAGGTTSGRRVGSGEERGAGAAGGGEGGSPDASRDGAFVAPKALEFLSPVPSGARRRAAPLQASIASQRYSPREDSDGDSDSDSEVSVKGREGGRHGAVSSRQAYRDDEDDEEGDEEEEDEEEALSDSDSDDDEDDVWDPSHATPLLPKGGRGARSLGGAGAQARASSLAPTAGAANGRGSRRTSREAENGAEDAEEQGGQWAAGRTGSSALTLAGLFDADTGTLALVYGGDHNTFELRANITQWSCRDLLAAIRDRLGYGSLSIGKLYFNCANAVRFWEEVVLTYGVSHVHRYGTYHHLACRGRHYIPYGEDNSPCAWHEDGGRLSSKVQGAPEQWVGGVKVWTNWAKAMEDWTPSPAAGLKYSFPMDRDPYPSRSRMAARRSRQDHWVMLARSSKVLWSPPYTSARVPVSASNSPANASTAGHSSQWAMT
ncbi:hypothetical protein TSOC_001313 [Tetrabaena socialis]|uniref:Uncharacterized protein n=1 Tax=Tetrabaena socialis TaxID=47790 RepID=A0A2J8AH41_9CHLO|nr:hypothetical protein TSOC_001313 [Tetrabaena socialis]|eukprot:PNH11827.1 hypothetical protein TSOC_001313 [Tetrabaena socialis]